MEEPILRKRRILTVLGCLSILLVCGSLYVAYKDKLKAVYSNPVNNKSLSNTASSVNESNDKITSADGSVNSQNQFLPVTHTTDTVESTLQKDSSQNDSSSVAKLELKGVVSQIADRPLYAKEVFLTFDDGPSSVNTYKILNILKENNVKATFFIIGKMAEQYPDRLRAVKTAGMSIQNHSYSHDYKMYKSIENCESDFIKANEVFKKLIDKDSTEFIRFPGGSDNTVSGSITMANIRRDILSKGIHYVDWNVSSTDASPTLVPTDRIVQIVTESCRYRSFAVVLMHDEDSKTTTVQALPQVIKYLKDRGFVFRTFDDVTPTELKEMIKERVADR